ncbi:MAG: glycosyltransferase family 2 protein [Pseudomonadota bacterium]
MVNSASGLASVIVPIYNAEHYLAETIQSALDQTYANFELILVDDGSTDGSAKICQSFSDPRIHYLRQENRGVSVARNTGLRVARGAFVAFLDSDDLWHREKIEAHVAHLQRNPDVGVSYANCRFIDANGNQLNRVFRPKQSNIRVADVYCRNPIAGGSSAFFRRTIFDDIVEPRSGDGLTQWFDPEASAPGTSFGEDHQCWLRMAIHSRYRFEGVDRILTDYRLHEAGLSAKVGSMAQGWQAIDAYVRSVRPDIHRRYSTAANAYQMRYFARRLVAQGDGQQALSYMAKSLRHSLVPMAQEPTKTLSTLFAAIALLIAPGTVARIMKMPAQAQRKPG